MAVGIGIGIILILLIILIMICGYFFWFSILKWKERELPDGYDDREVACFGKFHKEVLEGKKWIRAHQSDRVTITSRDGLKLVGFYVPAEVESDQTILLMHGYRSDGYGDFSCVADFYHEQGYNLFIAQQRCHGESEGNCIGFGVLERYDCKQWVEYLNERFNGQHDIFLTGVSMGCSTVLMAAGLELPENVRGIIADCGFTSPWDIFAHILKRDFNLPPFPILYIENLVSKVFAKYGFKDCSTLDILKSNRIPILFIHGGKDDFVPTWMGKANYEACMAEKELLIVEEADHATASMHEPERYREVALRFLKKYQTRDKYKENQPLF